MIRTVTEEQDARAGLRRAEIFLSERRANPGDRSPETLAVARDVSQRAAKLRGELAAYEARRRKALAARWHEYPCRWRPKG